MRKNIFFKSFFVITVVIIFIFLIFSVYFAQKTYSSIFRLSKNQVTSYLSIIKPICSKITDCQLLPGDILIRRYITNKTWAFSEFAKPYFTHSAFYLGDDKVIEAIGTEKDHKKEIQISKLSKSDWLDNNIESFVIVRPKYTTEKLKRVKTNLIAIANDPDYRFGLPQTGVKQTTCADLILKQLINEKVTNLSNIPNIITPDYLFWIAVNNPDNFQIIGSNIHK